MRKNRELILKYLAGQLEDEKSFLKRLESDKDLAREFESMSVGLNKFTSSDEVELNDQYFNSIIPKVRTKIDNQKSFFGRRSFVYSMSSVMATVIIFFMFNINFSSKMNSSELFSEMMEDFGSEELLTALDDDDYLNTLYSSEDILDSYEVQASLSEEYYFYYEDPSSLSSIYSNDYIDQLSDEEMELILEKLENKNFF